MKIYVVMGTTDEYSAREIWLVRAFFSKKEAEEYVVKADEWANAFWIPRRSKLDGIRCLLDQPKKPESPFDPNMKMTYYTGTDYWYEEVELENMT